MAFTACHLRRIVYNSTDTFYMTFDARFSSIYRRNAAPGAWLMFALPFAIIVGHFKCRSNSEQYEISTILSVGLLISAASNALHCERFPAKPLGYIVAAVVDAQLLTLYTDLGKSMKI